MGEKIGLNTLCIRIIFAFTVFFAFSGYVGAENFIPKYGENKTFTLTNQNETIAFGSGKLFLPTLLGCDVGVQDGVAVLTDTNGIFIGAPIFKAGSNRSPIYIEYDSLILKGTGTFTRTTATTCFFFGKLVDESVWNTYADLSNTGTSVTVTNYFTGVTDFSGATWQVYGSGVLDVTQTGAITLSGLTVDVSTGTGRTAEEWFTEVANAPSAGSFLIWLVIQIVLLVVFPIGAWIIGYRYGERFFKKK